MSRTTEPQKCTHCGSPIPSDYKGPCPKCGKPEDTKLESHGLVSAQEAGTFELSVRTNLSLDHIWAADHFAQLSEEIEKNNVDSHKLSHQLRAKHRSYIIGAIISAVAFLEATINEIYIDATEESKDLTSSLASHIVSAIGELWEVVEQYPILKKYQLMLCISGKGTFDRGKSPYQDVDGLIRLRHALAHYKPEWDTDQKEHKMIEDRLRYRFPLNPFAHENDAFFPPRCLGSGCARWAVSKSIEFVKMFFDRMELQQKLESYRSRLIFFVIAP